MQHADLDQLTLLALGERLDEPAVTDHLARCAACRAQVEALRHTVELARETSEHRHESPPPEEVWTRIAGELGLSAPAAAPVPVTRRRWVRPALALAAAVAIGVLGTLGAVRPWRTDPPPAVTSLALLAPVAGGPSGVTGQAVVVRGPSGPELRITAAGLPLRQGYYEVWVYDGERAMVSLGVLAADSTASLPLPPTLDLRTYHVVDISEERYDGNQTHSGTSVLRGTLTG